MSGGVGVLTLTELQAALRAGAGATEALIATQHTGLLDEIARAARLGTPLEQLANEIATGDDSADFLVRCLALAERTGTGAQDAIDRALEDIRDEARLTRLLAARTAQARGTAKILAALPLVLWLALIAMDRHALAFYGTAAGWLTGTAAVGLAMAAWRWMARLIRRTALAAAAADPLAPPVPPPSWRRGLVAGVPGALLVGLPAGPVAGLFAGAVLTLLVARGRPRPVPAAGAAEAISLVAVALEGGLAPAAALAQVARVAPAAAREALDTGAARMHAGWRSDDALDDTALAPLGQVLAVSQRWGAPAAAALRDLAAELREERRAAVDIATERLQLALIFPTTLLTLPAFILGVVPPLLWSTVGG